MTSTILEDVLEPVAACLTEDAARRIVNLRANPAAQARLDELADKANEGGLTEDERAQYDQMLAAFHLITILQARARTMLQKRTEA